MKILVTGGAGFIGSSVIRYIIKDTKDEVLNIDALTYAGNLESLKDISGSERYEFKRLNICDYKELRNVVLKFKPNKIMHLAAESHVDRSIDGAGEFVKTNIIGTFNLLESAREYYRGLSEEDKKIFMFHHISTDEVYGDLELSNELFTEETPYDPSSPYSATKASSDHLVRAWRRTYGLPTVITNCSNNYGPYHFPEKLIPLIILNAIEGKTLPIYGDGKQIRDWLYVEDHARALYTVATKGLSGETYNIGGHNEKMNIEVVKTVCSLLEKHRPDKPNGLTRYEDLIEYVADRPGHDLRYAIDASKIERELAWKPLETFESGIEKTILWYLENKKWWENILSGGYCRERLGKEIK